MTDERADEVGKLQEIMESLPDSSDYAGHERREYSLTKGDVLLIYKIAKVANSPHTCPFGDDEAETLRNTAKNINTTQKIASVVIVTSLVSGMLAGIWMMIVYFVKGLIAGGGK